MFFARRLLLVEGDAEVLLIPALARQQGIDLADIGVSVVSAAGLNFEIFLPFIRGDVLGIPAAILTDGDPPRPKPRADSTRPLADEKSADDSQRADHDVDRGSAYGRQSH